MRKYIYLFLLLGILLFHGAVNYQVLKQSQISRIYDEGARVYYGIIYFQDFFQTPQADLAKNINETLSLSAYQFHPHLFEFLEALSFKALSFFNKLDIDLMILITNLFFLLILLVSVYKIGLNIYDKNTGLFCAFLVSLFPLVFGHSRVAMLDYPLMCLVTLSMYFLLKTKAFSSVLYSVLAGLMFGLAQWVKESAVLFILPSLGYYFLTAYLPERKKRVFLNFLLSVLFFVIISGIVYLRKENLQCFKIYFTKIYYIHNKPGIYYYAKNFVNLTGPFIFFASLPLLLSYLINLKNRPKLLFVWFFVPLLLFSLSPNKSLRFILPVLPAFALIIAGEIREADWLKPFRIIYSVGLGLLALLQYVFLNFGFLKLDKYYPQQSMEGGILSARKDKYACAASGLLSIFKKEAVSNENKYKAILFLFNVGEIYWPIRLQVVLDRLPYLTHCYIDFDRADKVNFNLTQTDWSEKILSADYIIDKSGNVNISNWVKESSDTQKRIFEENKGKFELIDRIEVFDDSIVYVYKRKIEPDAQPN